MGIDKHLILTLEKSIHRQWAVLGGSVAMQTPIEKIEFIKGHDIDDEMHVIATTAADDGFPHAYHFAKGLKSEYIQQSASAVCQVWNFSRILRHIARGNETCMVTWDDRILTIPFPIVDRIVESLQARDEEFLLFQLRMRFGDTTTCNDRILEVHPELIDDVEAIRPLMAENYEAFDKTLNERWHVEFDKFKEEHYQTGTPTDPKAYFAKYLQKNMLGYGESIVFSPKGAAWLLLQATYMETLETREESPDALWWHTEVARRSCFDAWISAELYESVKVALDDGKGIYCPKRLGVRYVQDWLPMGSNIEWTNPEAEVENLRTRTASINFLDIP